MLNPDILYPRDNNVPQVTWKIEDGIPGWDAKNKEFPPQVAEILYGAVLDNYDKYCLTHCFN